MDNADNLKSSTSHTMNFSADSGSKCVFGYIKIIVHLETKPELWGIAKICRKTKRRVGCYTPLTMNYFIDSTRRNPKPVTKLILAYLHRL